MWGFWDSAHWRPQAAIAEGDAVTPNQAGQAYIRLMHEVMLQLLWTMFQKAVKAWSQSLINILLA